MIRRLSLTLLPIAMAGFSLAGEPPAEGPPRQPFYAGVCAHFGQNKGIPERNLAMMKTAGILSLRDELSWGGVERDRGEYTIPERQSETFRLASRMGIAPMLIFDYANRLYDGGDRPRSAEAIEGYANYAAALVDHFGDHVRLYEVWNEYDIGIGMPEPFRKGGSPEDYVNMLKVVYRRLKALDPEVQVIGGAVTSGAVRGGWLEEALQRGLLDHCDMLSIHTYNYSRPAEERTPEAWCRWMREAQAMASRYRDGQQVPMYVTEMGWPTHVGKSNSTPPELSASYLGRLYLLARTLPFIRGVWWYDFQDDGWEDEYNEHNFGIVRPDLTPKPSYYVISDVSQLVARGNYLGSEQSEDPNLHVLRFELDGETVWAAWSADDKPRQLLIRTGAKDQPLVLHRLGNQSVERGWGSRAWVRQRGGARLVADQARIVVDDRPVLLRGGMEKAELLKVSEDLGSL